MLALCLSGSEDARVVDIVEPGEEGDVEVGKAQLARVLRGEADRAAEDRVVRPDPVLQEQREETDSEGQVETGVPAGEAGIDGADVTLEEQRLRVEVELTVELPVAVAAAELEAGEFVVLLKRREEGVYSFGAGDLEVDVDVQPGRDLGNILAVVACCRRPPSASRRRRRGPAAADSIDRGGCCSRRIGRRCIAGDLAREAGAAARPRSSRRRCRRSSWHRSSCRTADRVGKGLPCRPLCCVWLPLGRWCCRQSSLWSTRLRTAASAWSSAGSTREARPHLGQPASVAGLAAALACRRSCSRAGHHKVTTGDQRDSGGRCPGTVPKVASCVTSHVYAPRRGSDLRVGLGTASFGPIAGPQSEPSASRF